MLIIHWRPRYDHRNEVLSILSSQLEGLQLSNVPTIAEAVNEFVSRVSHNENGSNEGTQGDLEVSNEGPRNGKNRSISNNSDDLKSVRLKVKPPTTDSLQPSPPDSNRMMWTGRRQKDPVTPWTFEEAPVTCNIMDAFILRNTVKLLDTLAELDSESSSALNKHIASLQCKLLAIHVRKQRKVGFQNNKISSMSFATELLSRDSCDPCLLALNTMSPAQSQCHGKRSLSQTPYNRTGNPLDYSGRSSSSFPMETYTKPYLAPDSTYTQGPQSSQPNAASPSNMSQPGNLLPRQQIPPDLAQPNNLHRTSTYLENQQNDTAALLSFQGISPQQRTPVHRPYPPIQMSALPAPPSSVIYPAQSHSQPYNQSWSLTPHPVRQAWPAHSSGESTVASHGFERSPPFDTNTTRVWPGNASSTWTGQDPAQTMSAFSDPVGASTDQSLPPHGFSATTHNHPPMSSHPEEPPTVNPQSLTNTGYLIPGMVDYRNWTGDDEPVKRKQIQNRISKRRQSMLFILVEALKVSN